MRCAIISLSPFVCIPSTFFFNFPSSDASRAAARRRSSHSFTRSSSSSSSSSSCVFLSISWNTLNPTAKSSFNRCNSFVFSYETLPEKRRGINNNNNNNEG